MSIAFTRVFAAKRSFLKKSRVLNIFTPLAVVSALVGCETGSIDGGWKASRTSDPITGETRCVVARFDRSYGSVYSRTGSLYPLVEVHPKHGLLVGVSSGGRVRLPVGNIQWRVDGLPYRTILAAESPADEGNHFLSMMSTEPDYPGLSDDQKVLLKSQLEAAKKATAGMISPTTVASGDTAREMLSEMLSGQSLLFRASANHNNLGLPSSNLYAVGEMTSKGMRPIQLDHTFLSGLQACNIQ